MANDTSAILEGLRTLFDGSSTFMSGHQIIRARTVSRKLSRKVPDWAKDDSAVQALLLRAFPNLQVNLEQRRRAGRWAMVVQLYFREQKSWRETADEMGEKPATILSLTRSIARAVAGRRANGSGARRKR